MILSCENIPWAIDCVIKLLKIVNRRDRIQYFELQMQTYINLVHWRFHNNHRFVFSTYYRDEEIEMFQYQNDDQYISKSKMNRFFSRLFDADRVLWTVWIMSNVDWMDVYPWSWFHSFHRFLDRFLPMRTRKLSWKRIELLLPAIRVNWSRWLSFTGSM